MAVEFLVAFAQLFFDDSRISHAFFPDGTALLLLQRWVPMMPMLTPRSYLTAVAAASSIYAIGGYIGGTVRHPSGDLTLDSVER